MAVKNTGKSQPQKAEGTKRTSEAAFRDAKRRQIWSIVLFAFGILITLFSFIGNSNTESPNGADLVHSFLCGILGIAVFFAGPIVIYIAVILSADKSKNTIKSKLIQLSVTMLLICAAMHIFFGVKSETEGFFEIISGIYDSGKRLEGGGVFGLLFGAPLLLLGDLSAKIVIILIIFVFVMLTLNITLADFFRVLAVPLKKIAEFLKNKQRVYKEDSELLRLENEKKMPVQPSEDKAFSYPDEKTIERKIKKAKSLATMEAAANINKTAETAGELNETAESVITSSKKSLADEIKHCLSDDGGLTEDSTFAGNPVADDDGPYSPEDNAIKNAVFEAIEAFKNEEIEAEIRNRENESSVLSMDNAERISEEPPVPQYDQQLFEVKPVVYTLPPITLLNDIVQEKSDEDIAAELESNSVTLVETLKSFGVQTKIVGVCRGPSVTRYELQPAPGVKIASITKLIDDLALNLATAGVRIEAPIPNKAAVGIEVPNRKVDTVPFRSLVDSKAFSDTDSKLGAVLGKDISGGIIIADVAKMPHLLIAGTTGSGKSVCVNSIIMSILFRSTPDEVRLLMIDPKAVEFMIYNGIPHLLIPVVTDPKKAAGALGWAVTEMLNRYKAFADNNVRDLNGYNSLCKGDPDLEPMPQIVIFIDELADLMMASPGEVESSICRLAQMARAAGMHLVIATQRPSVNVVTGVIKANIPSRIALKVASQVDSRTIIDSAGAEKLLGKGDMLYFPVGIPKPMRVQGCWVSDKEVERVVNFIKSSFVLKYDEKVIEEIERQAETVGNEKGKKQADIPSGGFDSSDDKLDEAIDAVIEAGQASTSYLQRKLGLGYGRAAKLIDIMEELGVVGEFKGSKPREILMTKQDWYERKLNNSK